MLNELPIQTAVKILLTDVQFFDHLCLTFLLIDTVSLSLFKYESIRTLHG